MSLSNGSPLSVGLVEEALSQIKDLPESTLILFYLDTIKRLDISTISKKTWKYQFKEASFPKISTKM